jgi:hypothetical protein
MIGGRDMRAYRVAAQEHGHASDLGFASGTDLDPFVPVDGVSLPAPAGGNIFIEEMLAMRPLDQEPIFLETTVGRDGRVRNPRVLQGDAHLANSLIQAMRMQQFVPAQDDGRPVAVRTYRLFDSVEVRVPRT